ncbi:hypothetical protein P8C59_003500 [Phyllachora maydis]|uniref:Integrase catalytic domain-containing protein n=1 Tax=Phyllachora maydis TaxID=1825666 RepID=A0AAD9I0E6_9PEZI|nr:hypothetical protein P8C59_003500 [Phyllachora maydis]
MGLFKPLIAEIIHYKVNSSLFIIADQAKGKGKAGKRASNPADLGQSSRPLLPIRTLLEDKEDGEDYSEVIEVLKQHIKSYKRVIASQSSDIKTLLLSLNTLKASVEDSVSAIKNISSTLASLTNSSNAAATRKTRYSPRFDPFSGTMDLDSPPRPPRKEPHLGPAIDNTATSNLDPPIDTGSKEGFKDTITSSIVKELSKKAYTIPDDSKLNRESNFKQWIQALTVLLMLLRDSLSSSPRAAISWIYIPSKAFKLLVRQYSRSIKSKKEDVYHEFHALTLSTYKKGLSAFNAEFNGYLAKLTMAKIDIDPSLILNQYFKALESKFPSWAYRAAYIANSSNSTPNSNSNPSKMGKNKKKGSYNLAIEEEEESDSSSNSNHISNSKERFTTFTPNIGQLRPIKTGNGPISPAGIGSITLEVLSRKAPPTYTKLVLDNVLYLPNIDINIVSRVRYYDSGDCLIKETLYRGDRRYIAILDFKKSGFFLDIKGSSKPILHTNFAFPLGLSSYTTKSIELQRNKIVVEIPSNSIRKEDYRPIIEDAIVSEAIEPNKRYKLRNSPAKGTTLEGIGPSLRGKRPSKLWHVRLGHIGLRLLKKTSSITKGLPNFDKIKEADFHCSSCDRGKAVRRVSKALIPDPPRVLDSIEGDTVKIRPRPYNRNPIVLLLVDRKSRYRWVFNLPNKSGPIVANAVKGFFRGLRNGFGRYPTKFHFDGGTEITDLLTIWLAKRVLKTSTIKFIKDNTVLSQPTDNTALERELVDLDLDLEGAISLDPSNLNTEKPISIEIGPSKLEPYESSSDSELDKPLPDKPINPVIVESTRPTISIRKPELPEAFPQTIEPTFIPKPIEVIAPNQPITNEPLNNSNLISEGDKMQLDYYKLLAKTSSYILDERSKWLEAITKEFIQLLELGVFKFLPRSLLPSNYKLITCRNVLKVKKDAKNRPTKYKSREEIYMEIPEGLLDLATSNKAIYKLFLKYGYNPFTPNIIKLSKALYDDCLFIGPNIGYITDLKKRLNKVYAIEDLGPAAYFLGVQIIRDRPNRRLWLNQPLTTTSTTILDSRNSKGSSRTSIINSSLVPIGFSDSDFTGDKATSKSTYGYLYKLAGRPISWKTKRATTIALSTLEAETDGLIEAIREVQTKHTLLKFRYVREQVKAKIVTIIYLNTKFNSTGYFTAL